MQHEISLCSVSFNSAGFLRLNERLARALNPGATLHWIVAENSPADSSRALGDTDRGAFELLPGAGPGHIPNFHHTLALASCLRRASTRFVAVVDPDLFVVRRDWVREIVEHMQQQGLAFMGVPWHPQSAGKYRYFPAVHFSVFDTQRFRREDIDFLPDYPDGDQDPAWAAGWTLEKSYFVRSPLARWLAKLPLMAPRRQYYTDTGSRFFKRWVDDASVKYETLVPRWPGPTRRPGLRGLIDQLMPDELDYEPRRYPRASYRQSTSMAAALSSMPSRWECFEWRDDLFCFHVRGNLDRNVRSSGGELGIAAGLAAAACGGELP